MLIIDTVIFVSIEFAVWYVKNMVETAINRYAATAQMAIDTGYRYSLSIEVVNIAWLFIAITVAVMFGITVYFQIKKEK